MTKEGGFDNDVDWVQVQGSAMIQSIINAETTDQAKNACRKAWDWYYKGGLSSHPMGKTVNDLIKRTEATISSGFWKPAPPPVPPPKPKKSSPPVRNPAPPASGDYQALFYDAAMKADVAFNSKLKSFCSGRDLIMCQGCALRKAGGTVEPKIQRNACWTWVSKEPSTIAFLEFLYTPWKRGTESAGPS